MKHHDFKKGTNVYVIKKDGSTVIGKFEQKHSKAMTLRDKDNKKFRINFADIRSSTILNHAANKRGCKKSPIKK